MIPMYIVYRPIVGRLVVLYYYISIILDLSFFVILKEFLDPNCCLAQNTNSYNHDVKYGNNEPWLKTVKKNDKSLCISQIFVLESNNKSKVFLEILNLSIEMWVLGKQISP